jgi:L,D-peptidoglycan transpeptidase YkuD (ErfK/YbiS/YcfS/YnhG family)
MPLPLSIKTVQPEVLLNRIGPILFQSSQVVVVTNDDPRSSVAVLFALEERDGHWQQAFLPMEAVIGRNGFAHIGEKREGDGKTPSGVFPLSIVFGYHKTPPTRMPYRVITREDVWVDDPASPDYNTAVKRDRTAALSFEEMRRHDDLYKYVIVVDYNTMPVVKDRGSAIFIHLWKGPGEPSAGCIALAEDDVRKLIGWLDPLARPVIVLGTPDTLNGSER